MGGDLSINSEFMRSAVQEAVRRDGASLRDPAGYVFEAEGRICRLLTGSAVEVWQEFSATQECQRWMVDGSLVRTTPANATVTALLGDAVPSGKVLVLEHERVPVISYAQEWSTSMLRDAALLHLDLMSELIPAGWTLKDAHPSNVQWMYGRPCLIDIASVDRYRDGPWRAYGQFCRTMLFPLLSSCYGGVPLQVILKGFGPSGMDSPSAARLLRGRAIFKPGVWMHVRLQALLQRTADRQRGTSTGAELATSMNGEAVLRMLAGLRTALLALPALSQSSWTDYRFTSTYTPEQIQAKHAIVEQWCRAHVRKDELALDVGCNTGEYSELLACHAGKVISIDADMSCIDRLYRRQIPGVLPLVVDAAAPTPASGWALAEQRDFMARVRPDWSIWLAVIHHLSIHNGVRLDAVVAWMLTISPRLIVEFVAPEDAMVRALLKERGIERPDYSEANFQRLLAERGMVVLERREVAPTRTLYLLEDGAVR